MYVCTDFILLGRYLQFVNGEAMVFLQDKEDVVMSLPPLTNSEVTKVSDI